MLNIGWTIGPPLGTLLVMQSINLPFWLAAICSAFPMLFIQIWVKQRKIIATETGSVWSPKVYYKIKHCCGLPALAFWLLLLAAHLLHAFHNM